MDEGRESKKLTMVFVYATYCDWCEKMDNEAFKDKGTIQLTSRVVPVRANSDSESRFLRKFGVKGYPVVIFIDAKGEKFGELFGYVPTQLFRDELRKFIDAYDAWPELVRDLERDPDDGELNARMAWFYGIRRDLDNALVHLKKTERTNYRGAHLAKAYNMIGDVYQLSDRVSTAVSYFRKALATTDNVRDKAYALISLASCYRAMGDTKSMEKFARMVIELKGAPNDYVDFARQMLKH